MTGSAETDWREAMEDAEPSGVEAARGQGAGAVPGLEEMVRSGAPGAGPLLALSTLGEMPCPEAEEALFRLAADADEGVARLALTELTPRLEPDRVGRVLALLERRLEPSVRALLYELAARLDAPLEPVRAAWDARPPTDEAEARAALLARYLLGDADAFEPLADALGAMDPVDAGEPLELLRARPLDPPARRVLRALLDDARLVDQPPPEELDLGLGPGLRVCDLAAACALELLDDDALPEMRRYDDEERRALDEALRGADELSRA